MKRLRELRQSQKITQIKLAMDVNISQKMISAYERGTNEPSLEMLKKFARYFNTSVDYLIGYTDVRHPSALMGKELTDGELNIMESYNKLSKDNKYKAEGYIQALLDSQREQEA